LQDADGFSELALSGAFSRFVRKPGGFSSGIDALFRVLDDNLITFDLHQNRLRKKAELFEHECGNLR